MPDELQHSKRELYVPEHKRHTHVVCLVLSATRHVTPEDNTTERTNTEVMRKIRRGGRNLTSAVVVPSNATTTSMVESIIWNARREFLDFIYLIVIMVFEYARVPPVYQTQTALTAGST